MYGRDNTATVNRSQVAPAPSAPPTQSGGSRVKTTQQAAALGIFPFVLVAAVVLYFVWALLEQHERVKSAIQPKAIAINLRNLAVIMATVILGLNIFKVAAVKYSAITQGRFGGRILVTLAGGA
ncbi:MAG TPA: hypothetical protein VNH17_21055 [Streptosporangiaceae bacterium]|nr:hypothetical protein [Streptosporangiaceae bacterium]